MYELVIIGGGPAGIAAGIYAARKKIKFVLVAKELAGQSKVSEDIENWVGEKHISGYELAKKTESHLKSIAGAEIREGEETVGVEKTAAGFSVKLKSGEEIETMTVLVASGSGERKLGVPGEEDFAGRGVVYCATCDAPLFKGKNVVVVGSGNAALEAVIDLFAYAKKIYLLVRSAGVKGDPVTFEKISRTPEAEMIFNAEVVEVYGQDFVEGVRYKDKISGEIKELAVSGVFVEIGSAPNSEVVKGLAEINEQGRIVVDHKTFRASTEGIWAAGDVCDTLYRQNNIAAGDAIKAVLNINDFLNKNRKSAV